MKKFVGTIGVAHTGKESLIYDLAKILGCDDTEEQVVDAVKRLKAEMEADDQDICGLCGQPGADKIPHPEHWPGERIPDSELVHAECENEECRRAHTEFYNRVGDGGVREFLHNL